MRSAGWITTTLRHPPQASLKEARIPHITHTRADQGSNHTRNVCTTARASRMSQVRDTPISRRQTAQPYGSCYGRQPSAHPYSNVACGDSCTPALVALIGLTSDLFRRTYHRFDISAHHRSAQVKSSSPKSSVRSPKKRKRHSIKSHRPKPLSFGQLWTNS